MCNQFHNVFLFKERKLTKEKLENLLLMPFLDVFPKKYSNKSMSYRDLRLLLDDGEFNKTGKL